MTRAVKSAQFNLKPDIHQTLQLDCQDISVPASFQSDGIVGDDVSSLIGLVHVRQPD